MNSETNDKLYEGPHGLKAAFIFRIHAMWWWSSQCVVEVQQLTEIQYGPLVRQ